MKGLKMDLVRVLVPLCLISLVAGCGLFNVYHNMSALDKAVVTASQLTAWQISTQKSITDMYNVGTPEKKAWLIKNVNPNMNKLKRSIILYVDAVKLWQDSGAEPMNLQSLLNSIQVMSSDLLKVLGGI